MPLSLHILICTFLLLGSKPIFLYGIPCYLYVGASYTFHHCNHTLEVVCLVSPSCLGKHFLLSLLFSWFHELWMFWLSHCTVRIRRHEDSNPSRAYLFFNLSFTIHYALFNTFIQIFYHHSLHVIYLSLWAKYTISLAPSNVCLWIESCSASCQTLNSLCFRPFHIVVPCLSPPHIGSCHL